MSSTIIDTISAAKASQDSEEGRAQIDPPEAAALTGEPPQESSGAANDAQRTSQQVGNHQNGHTDPTQRKVYLILFGFSALNAAIGLILIIVWMFNYRPETGIGLTSKGQLANLHPILMYSFMVSLNMYAVLVYRTHFNQEKSQLKWTHAILSGTNIVMSLLGVAAMYKAHLIGNQANFYSLHSWIGALTNGLYLSQFIFGFVAFLKPGLALHKRVALMPWHRLFGTMILVLASTAAITGISELVIFQDTNGVYQHFSDITFIANFAGICTLLMTAISVYLLTASHYMRPARPEELPPKR